MANDNQLFWTIFVNYFTNMAPQIPESTPFFDIEFQKTAPKYLIPVLPRSSETDGTWKWSADLVSVMKFAITLKEL